MLTHEQVQAAISAQLDGEPVPLSQDIIDTHVHNCPECAAFREKAAALSRSLSTVEPAAGMAPPRDLSESILAEVEPEWQRASSARHASLTAARIVVGVLALAFLVWAVAMVVSSSGLAVQGAEGTLQPDADPDKASLLIEGAAMRFALASGLAFAAWRPQSAPGLAPVAWTMFAFLFGFGMRDIALGTMTMSQIYALLASGAAALGVGWVWAADKGYLLADAWRSLSAQPR
ncbi:zf-HC2 domain-containing protein [Corynebacterium sp.]|uniref:zf-HC2 domain-containing protein n=1 Tax=Corynebacterium sp. TaxID=1720 RepID=UPI0026DB6E22|nr:zf-HC2 domain-containing protein [Corynebacterium sp.]MDO5033029.1 zf-HC2 domain-containing protein [Corynebacterium sp.]